MNKYKMVSICSFCIVCILTISVLLPVKSNANDKESIELKLHYEGSTVTASILVNSEIYTGVVCKYIAVDDILQYDDLAYQTKENGQSLNVNKIENDSYSVVMENVSTRYIVVYVSIGNCSICDYIDTKLKNDAVTSNNQKNADNKQIEKQNTDQANTNQDLENKQNLETTNQEEQPQSNEHLKSSEQPSVNTEENNKSSNENVQPAENNQNNNEHQDSNEQQVNSNDQNEAIVVDNNSSQTATEFQTIEDKSSKKVATEKTESKTVASTSSSKNEKTTSANSTKTTATKSNAIDLNSYNKDSIDVSGYEEIIDKTKSASTVEGSMPQTGEDDTFKIAGIVIFSFIGIVSFYKYVKTK